jgi:ribosomal protein L7/L12
MNHRVLDTLKACLTGDYSIYEIKRFLFELALSEAQGQPQAEAATTSRSDRYILHGSVGYGVGAQNFEMYFLDGKLTSSKIGAIKYIREVTNMGLKDAKDYVECLPVVVAKAAIVS